MWKNRTFLALAVAAVQLIFVASPIAALDRPEAVQGEAERHCVVSVEDNGRGTLETNSETCFETALEASSAAEKLVATGERSSRSAGNTVIGLHYTSKNFLGSSVTVVGTTCSGGVWYPTGFWNNNIESSRHYCGSAGTTFYNWSSCGGSTRTITSAATSLGNLNNRASCVRYG